MEGLYEPVDILAHHIKNEMHIWAAVDRETRAIEMVVVAQIQRYPRKAVLGCPYVGGRRLRECGRPFFDELIRFAKNSGCSRIAGGYRRGWIKVFGFREMPMLWKDL